MSEETLTLQGNDIITVRRLMTAGSGIIGGKRLLPGHARTVRRAQYERAEQRSPGYVIILDVVQERIDALDAGKKVAAPRAKAKSKPEKVAKPDPRKTQSEGQGPKPQAEPVLEKPEPVEEL